MLGILVRHVPTGIIAKVERVSDDGPAIPVLRLKDRWFDISDCQIVAASGA